MEILLNQINELTPDLLLYAGIAIGVLVLLLVYRLVIAPRRRHRKALEKVRQIQYEKEVKKLARAGSYTWGTFTRSSARTGYDVKEFSPQEDNTIHKIMRDLSPEEITNIVGETDITNIVEEIDITA